MNYQLSLFLLLMCLLSIPACQKTTPTTPSHCTNGILDGDEVGTDCGGSCTACSGPSHCYNGVMDGDETGIDCGGSCDTCIVYPSHCSNGILDGNEVGVDCGGSCAACTNPSHCFNGLMDGDETGVDCGGSCDACIDPFPMDTLSNFNEDIDVIKFYDTSIGFLSTKTSISAGLHKTTDGGTTWNSINIPTSNYITDIEFGSTSDKIFICDNNNSAYMSDNGGLTWVSILTASGNAGNIEILTDTKWLWNDNLSSIYYSDDAGATYNVATINGSTNLDATDLYQFFNDSVGYTFMRDGGNGDVYFYKTVDGGQVWDLVLQTAFSQTPYMMHFLNENEAFAQVYTDIIKTTNGGQNWSIAQSNCSGSFLHFYNGKATALCFRPLYSLDNGATWTNYKDAGNNNYVLSTGIQTYGAPFARDNFVYFTSQDKRNLIRYDMNEIN